MLYQIDYKLQSTDRLSIRKELISLFLQERDGCSETDGVARYKYCVENIDPYAIYLQRPAPLNKGFDFIVNVENLYFKLNDTRRHRNPSHKDIVDILEKYKNTNPTIYNKVSLLIQSIYECCNIDIIKESHDLPLFTNWDNQNIPIGVILACIKWLFIEQDVTYWNWSGRNMFLDELKRNSLV